MTHLTLDFSVCSPLSQGLGIKLTPKPVPRSRPRWQPLWDTPNKLPWRTASPLARRLANPIPPLQDSRAGLKVKAQKHRKPAHKGQAACKDCRLRYSQKETGDPLAVIAEAPAALSSGSRGDAVRLLLRARRQLKWDSYDKSQEGRTTTVAGFIDWGPTGTDSIDDDGKPETNMTLSTRVSTTTVATTTSTTTRLSQRTFTVVTTPEPRRLSTTKAPVVETVKPPKPYEETPGETLNVNRWVLLGSCFSHTLQSYRMSWAQNRYSAVKMFLRSLQCPTLCLRFILQEVILTKKIAPFTFSQRGLTIHDIAANKWQICTAQKWTPWI